MARILYVNELGTDCSRVHSFLPLALALKQRGHEVAFALPELTQADTLLLPHGFKLMQAPFWHATTQAAATPLESHVQLMLLTGFTHPGTLLGAVRAWRHLWALESTDLLITESAPIAQLAARGLGMPLVAFGDGLAQTPLTRPAPPHHAVHLQWEQTVLACANAVLDILQTPHVACLAELLQTHATVPTAFPKAAMLEDALAVCECLACTTASPSVV